MALAQIPHLTLAQNNLWVFLDIPLYYANEKPENNNKSNTYFRSDNE